MTPHMNLVNRAPAEHTKTPSVMRSARIAHRHRIQRLSARVGHVRATVHAFSHVMTRAHAYAMLVITVILRLGTHVRSVLRIPEVIARSVIAHP